MGPSERAPDETDRKLMDEVLRGPFGRLRAKGVIDEAGLLDVELSARRLKADSASILMRRYKVSRADLRDCLTAYYGLPFVEYSPDLRASPEIIDKLSRRYLNRVGWVPLSSPAEPRGSEAELSSVEVVAINPASGRSKSLDAEELGALIELLAEYERFLRRAAPDAAGASEPRARTNFERLSRRFEEMGLDVKWFERSAEEASIPLYRSRTARGESEGCDLKSLLAAVRGAGAALEDPAVSILIDNPRNAWKVQDIHAIFRDREIRWFVGFREDILRFIDSAFGAVPPERSIASIMTELGDAAAAPAEAERDDAGEIVTESDSTIILLVNKIILEAHKQGASDIHIEPNSGDRETWIRFRVDGHCRPYLKVPGSYRKPLAARVKILAGLDISERRKPQDGKIVFRSGAQKLELRVATIPTSGPGNEDVVLRLLSSGEPPPIDKLNLSERNHRCLAALLEKPYGLILCAGPTGSGKTTTLHSALRHLNRPEKKIWTAEDPVEITQAGLRQAPVQSKIGLGFAALLRSFLRADPDVIMIGEMRDQETIEIALKASLTGHLVLSTLHTNSAPETVSRLLDMGVDPFSFGDALLGVLGQRLVQTLCAHCRRPYDAPPGEEREFRDAYGEEAFARLGRPAGAGLRLHRAGGCAACGGTGYKGRTGIHELLVVTEPIRALIHARAPISEIQRTAASQGMTTLCQDGLMKCLLGQTDLRQIVAKTG
ncbi:MAG TPA: GspE/PulE family protein [Elusimicrobiota bacterium]|nr:GspE/PulE family protein [Elusimicrobiota bacterium]